MGDSGWSLGWGRGSRDLGGPGTAPQSAPTPEPCVAPPEPSPSTQVRDSSSAVVYMGFMSLLGLPRAVDPNPSALGWR